MALTCAQVVTRAVTDAAVPNYKVQAGQKLQLILDELAALYDWDILRTLTTIAVSSGTNQYSLPQDYLRARKAFYYINGQEINVSFIPREQWVQLFQGPGNTTYPTWACSDLSPLQSDPATQPQIYLWPTPAQSITLNLLYFKQSPTYTSPENSASVPWFPYQNYLIKRLTADLMNSSADGRKGQLLSECEAFLNKYGVLANDEEDFAVTIKKDPRRFRQGTLDARPTKQVPL